MNGRPNKWNYVTGKVIGWGSYVGKSRNKVSIARPRNDLSSLADLSVGHSSTDFALSVEGVTPLAE